MHGSTEGVREVYVDDGLEYGVYDHEMERDLQHEGHEDEILAYGEHVMDEKAGAIYTRNLGGNFDEHKKERASIDAGTTRFLEIENIEAGPEIDSDDDSGTVTDDYDADSSEADLPPGPVFNSQRYGEVTGGLSEISLWDTAICVGFGYALVYSS